MGVFFFGGLVLFLFMGGLVRGFNVFSPKGLHMSWPSIIPVIGFGLIRRYDLSAETRTIYRLQ